MAIDVYDTTILLSFEDEKQETLTQNTFVFIYPEEEKVGHIIQKETLTSFEKCCKSLLNY